MEFIVNYYYQGGMSMPTAVKVAPKPVYTPPPPPKPVYTAPKPTLAPTPKVNISPAAVYTPSPAPSKPVTYSPPKPVVSMSAPQNSSVNSLLSNPSVPDYVKNSIKSSTSSQQPSSSNNKSVTAGDVAGKTIKSTIEGTADAIIGKNIFEKLSDTTKSMTKIPALGVAAEVETISINVGAKALKGASKIAGPLAVASYGYDVAQDIKKYDGKNAVKAVTVTTVATGLAIAAGLTATGVGAPVGLAIAVGVGASVVAGFASDWIKQKWIGK